MILALLALTIHRSFVKNIRMYKLQSTSPDSTQIQYDTLISVVLRRQILQSVQLIRFVNYFFIFTPRALRS